MHIKNFLSGVFKFALREGVVDGVNPVAGSSVPGRPKKFYGDAYTLQQIDAMVDAIRWKITKAKTKASERNFDDALDVIVLLAFTGLRQSEARALRWSDWDKENARLHIRRSVWKNHVGPTKNPQSEDSVPVLETLTAFLTVRQGRMKPDPNDYIFAGKRKGQPLDFHNLINRQIKPALEDVEGIIWSGFHGFRRGLASNLFALNVNPKVVAAIMRHRSIAVTLDHYIKTPEAEAVSAMAKLQEQLSKPRQ
jgi:integrase